MSPLDLIAAAPALPLDEAGKYVAGAYVVFVLLLVVYVAIMAAKLGRIGREIEELTELAERREREAGGRPDDPGVHSGAAAEHAGGRPVGAAEGEPGR